MADLDTDKARKILIIDETLREGMQFHGLVFSLEQRIKILEFQEALGVDICQTGYPPALNQEAKLITDLADHARKNKFKIRTAALGRALPGDAEIICQTGVDDPHFHFHVNSTDSLEQVDALFATIKKEMPHAQISLAMLDMGKTDPDILDAGIDFFDKRGHLSILSLADTSGIMAPNEVQDQITRLAKKTNIIKLAIHCHNDMGMASANTFTGILAGAGVMEASVLGIGERNGIADLYTTAKLLKDQGIDTGLNLENVNGFKAYYTYVNNIVMEQTGLDLMGYCCPVFGRAVKTHVAGTHAGGQFGSAKEEEFFLNPLCGRGLVKKFLVQNKISFDGKGLGSITVAVKEKSMILGRCLLKQEVADLVHEKREKPDK